MNAAFSGSETEILRRVADALIPAADGMPSASDVDVHGTGAARVLAVRPELLERIAPVLVDCASCTDEAQLRTAAGDAFPALCELVAGAYFTTPRILEALAYPGRPALQLPDLEAQQRELASLTEPLVRAGPRWRSAQDEQIQPRPDAADVRKLG